MSKPLLADPKQKADASKWHDAVFAAHGKLCHFCGCKATDAMHVIPRARLGPLRYEIPQENGRPGCRRCHQDQELGIRRFSKRVVAEAIRAHNRIAKVPILEP